MIKKEKQSLTLAATCVVSWYKFARFESDWTHKNNSIRIGFNWQRIKITMRHVDCFHVNSYWLVIEHGGNSCSLVDKTTTTISTTLCYWTIKVYITYFACIVQIELSPNIFTVPFFRCACARVQLYVVNTTPDQWNAPRMVAKLGQQSRHRFPPGTVLTRKRTGSLGAVNRKHATPVCSKIEGTFYRVLISSCLRQCDSQTRKLRNPALFYGPRLLRY